MKEEDLFVVRLYDGFDGVWMDISGHVSKEEADRIWNEKTNNGTRMINFSDIDYYRIFPADTKMYFSRDTGNSLTRGKIGSKGK